MSGAKVPHNNTDPAIDVPVSAAKTPYELAKARFSHTSYMIVALPDLREQCQDCVKDSTVSVELRGKLYTADQLSEHRTTLFHSKKLQFRRWLESSMGKRLSNRNTGTKGRITYACHWRDDAIKGCDTVHKKLIDFEAHIARYHLKKVPVEHQPYLRTFYLHKNATASAKAKFTDNVFEIAKQEKKAAAPPPLPAIPTGIDHVNRLMYKADKDPVSQLQIAKYRKDIDAQLNKQFSAVTLQPTPVEEATEDALPAKDFPVKDFPVKDFPVKDFPVKAFK